MNDRGRLDAFVQAAFPAVGALLCVFVLAGVNTNLFSQQSNLALFGMLGLVLVFLRFPPAKRWAHVTPLRAADLVLCALTVFAFGYVFVQSEPMLESLWVDGQKLGDRAGNEGSLDFAVGLVGLLLVLEATRRAIGNTLPLLVGVFLAYAFAGPALPDWLFPHRGFDWQRVVSQTFLQSGVFGIALKVMFTYVFPFVLFGTLLEQTGATAYVINLARRMFRNSTGGPAKVAVVSSGLMGSLSGSAVANTATTGTFTIPLMKSSGFKSEDAAGIEAAASSGGALMPPIMGAGAYMMLEIVEPAVTLLEILRAALIPALLYYTALLMTVHFRARRAGAGTEEAAESELGTESGSGFHPSQGVMFFGSFLLLITLLFRFSPFRAVTICLLAILVGSCFSRHLRIGPRGVYQAMTKAAAGGVSLVAAAACVGIILGIVTLTGIGSKLPGAILPLAQDHLVLALALLMLSTIVLGMGLPSAVCYLLMATLVGPVLTDLGVVPLAAHLFIFYFGMMSMVTPPVALAAYTASAIAQAPVMASALAGFRYALIGFVLPYAFVLHPELLLIPGRGAGVGHVILHIAGVLLALVPLAAGLAGYFRRPLTALVRVGMVAAALVMLLATSLAVWLVALAAAAALLFFGARQRDAEGATA